MINKYLWIVLLLHYAVAAVAGDIETWRGAEWIGYTRDDRTSSYAMREVHPGRFKNPQSRRTHVSPLMRKTFNVDRAVRSANVRVCGLGLHELYLNGGKMGDRVLDPAPTSYDKRSFYTVHDVTTHLRQGRNAIGLMLGNGFYGQDLGFGAPHLQYGAPRAKLLLTIQYADGTTMRIGTDVSWKAAQSPIVFDNLYAGETYDARMEQSGWSSPDFDDASWKAVNKMDAPTDTLVEQRLEPIRKIRDVRPVAVWPAENGEWILDMGENMAGWLEMRLGELRGTEIELRFAELLMPGGKAIDTASTGIHATGCEQRDAYICKGGGETWEPRFTYHGFRYVQIRGLSKKPNPDNFTGWFVRTDLKRIGTFECSDPKINTFYEVSQRTIEANLHGLLSDCPHRERCAWLGDMHAAGETVSMNYAANGLWRKHVEDFRTVLGVSRTVKQHYPEGEIPPKDPRAPSNIACGKRLCGQARPDWGMAMVLVPWYNWLYYGDRETAENAWEMMVNYMEFLEEAEVDNGLIKEGFSYGDWCPPGGNTEMDTSPQLSASALYYNCNRVMHQMAKLLSKQAKAAEYAQLASHTKKVFNRKFFDLQDADYGSQTANAMVLGLGLVPDGREKAVAAALDRSIQKNGGHYTTGIMGHRHLYTVLNDNGFSETSRKLWSNTDYPSLGFMTEKHGLTTWPEQVDNWSRGKRYPRYSFNHPMQSGFAVAFHESIGGIRPDPDHPGFERFIFKPSFLDGLEWAKVDYDSPKGKISSHWQRKGDVVIWNIGVPQGSLARIELPVGTKILLNKKSADAGELTLPAGEWNLEVTLR